jgi:hypothetical protein
VLTDAFAFHRAGYAKETAGDFVQERPIIDTAFVQCIAVQCTDLAHTGELDRVLKEKALDLERLFKLMQRGKHSRKASQAVTQWMAARRSRSTSHTLKRLCGFDDAMIERKRRPNFS